MKFRHWKKKWFKAINLIWFLDRWMDDLGFCILFNSISVISGGWWGDNERKPVCIRALFLILDIQKCFRLAIIYSWCHKKNIWRMKCVFCNRTEHPHVCWLRLLYWQPTNCLTTNNVYLGFLNDAVWSLSVICCKSDDKITRQTYRDVNVQSNLISFNSVTVACG